MTRLIGDPALATGTALAGPHFYLECYVGSGSTTMSPFEGWATFHQIFVNARPYNYRFAIARMVPIYANHSVQHDGTVTMIAGHDLVGDWLCWDLHAVDREYANFLRSQQRLIFTPVPIWQSDSLDGLIMKALVIDAQTS